MGRVGGLAVALSLGAAILTGWNSGLAWADESGGTAGSTGSSAASGTEPGPANPGASEGTANSGDTGTNDHHEPDDGWRRALGTSWSRRQHGWARAG